MRHKIHNYRRLAVSAVVAVLTCGFIASIGIRAYAQDIKRKEAAVKKEENYTRPKPTQPIKPQIPSVNRYQQDKIFLEYADSLYKEESPLDTVEKQILKGNVKFRQAGMWMYCDSAYYYPGLNSLDAFGHVKMEQGDTLFVYADKLFYEGNERMAKLMNGPSRPKVNLINRDVTLTTDSLDYSLAMELGWYQKWGTIDDKVNTLTSLYGEYSPGTKNADFYHDVVLVNNENNFTMLTDTLHYNTDTHLARIESLTEIHGANDTIVTTSGIYDTQLGNAELLSRSMIIHRDSNNNITTLEGDSIIYDKLTRISKAFMFRDPNKHSAPMVLTDTAHNTTLIGGFGIYNDSTKEALATIYPLLMEYSQSDTLFLRADTIRTYIVTEMVKASRRWTASGYPEHNGKPIIKAESSYLWIDSDFFSIVASFISLPLKLLTEVAPIQPKKKSLKPAQSSSEPIAKDNVNPQLPLIDSLQIIANDTLQLIGNSTLQLIAQDSLGMISKDSLQIKADLKEMPLEGNIIEDLAATDSINLQADSLALNRKDSVPKDSVPKEFHVALAYHRARFFKQDIQGVADSMVFIEHDSMLYMFRKPIVWSGERQVTGNRIDIHFNDSTADWALLPESGMLSEHIDEDFYNQLSGKKLFATFKDQSLRRLEVDGNVETIFLPQEADSTFNRMVIAESSFLSIDLENNKMDKLKMWPEVSGTVTPIFLVKKSQQYLPNFRWWASLRPEREWYGDKMRWADNLGEVPDALEQYFLAPSDFGEPKSFSGTRFVMPASSLPLYDDIPASELMAPDSIATELVGSDTLKELEAEDKKLSEEAAKAVKQGEEIEKETKKEKEGKEVKTNSAIKKEETE